ncbi:MAG TPA: hypothetical protein VFK21_01485 [Gammaproteobacteria bacterium]|nr:hypothetical protein [Gammaproteobacteria bacterium]
MDFVYAFERDIEPGKPWYLALQLTDEELKAIGSVAVQWSIFEMTMYKHIEFLAQLGELELPKYWENQPLSKKFSLWREIANSVFKNDKNELDRVVEVIQAGASLSEQRDKLVHGHLDWDKANRDKLKLFSKRMPHGAPQKMDKERIEKLAMDIAIQNYNLMAVHGGIKIEQGAPQRVPLVPIPFVTKPENGSEG